MSQSDIISTRRYYGKYDSAQGRRQDRHRPVQEQDDEVRRQGHEGSQVRLRPRPPHLAFDLRYLPGHRPEFRIPHDAPRDPLPLPRRRVQVSNYPVLVTLRGGVEIVSAPFYLHSFSQESLMIFSRQDELRSTQSTYFKLCH